MVVNPRPEGLVLGVYAWDQAVLVLGLVYDKLVVAVVPGVALGAPYEAHLVKQLDPFLGEEAVLPLASETVLRPLGVDPRPEGLVLGVYAWDQAVLVLGLVFEKLAVAVVPGSQLLLPHFGFTHFEKKRKEKEGSGPPFSNSLRTLRQRRPFDLTISSISSKRLACSSFVALVTLAKQRQQLTRWRYLRSGFLLASPPNVFFITAWPCC